MNDLLREETTVELPEPPGRFLREGRAARGWSLEEVAGRLRLQVRLVSALEADDFDKLPPATFVSGYLRAYARLLELPEEEIVSRYTRRLEESSPLIVSNIRHGSQVRSSDPRVKVVTYLLVIGLAALLIAWWVAQREEPPAPPRTALVDGPEPVVEVPPPLAEPEPVEPQTQAAMGATQVANGETEVASASDWEVLEPGAPQPQSPPDAPTEGLAQYAPPQPEVPPLLPQTPQAELVLEFTDDCWTEVQDAAGRQLAYDLLRGGQRVTLRGEAPFRVFLGFAPAAGVLYQEESFDFQRYVRGDIARFRVGRAEDNRPVTESN